MQVLGLDNIDSLRLPRFSFTAGNVSIKAVLFVGMKPLANAVRQRFSAEAPRG